MGHPLVYIDTSAIGPGMLDRVMAALDDLVAFIEANEPQLMAYGAYVNDKATEMTVYHVHVDSASLEVHLDVAGLAKGKHLFQCCIHPWMRMEVEVE